MLQTNDDGDTFETLDAYAPEPDIHPDSESSLSGDSMPLTLGGQGHDAEEYWLFSSIPTFVISLFVVAVFLWAFSARVFWGAIWGGFIGGIFGGAVRRLWRKL